jgi:dienelactone hydrolase
MILCLLLSRNQTLKNMKKIILLITTCFTLICQAQTFPVGHMSINFKDASRTGGYSISGGITMPGTGRNIGTEVYYPATVAGNNTTVANGQFPIVVFGHGFAMTWDSYDNIYNRLAALGYIVLLPRTESSIFPTPNHANFGEDLKLLASQGLLLNSTSTPTALATFNGKVLQKSAIGGHSMGAGCSFIAAQNNTTVTCIFNLAAATSNTAGISSVAGASLVTVPLLMISGEKDNVADTTVQNSHYTPTASSIKFHSIIKDVTHCDFGNGTSGTCTIGQAACSGAGCNATLFARYMSYIEPFLANQLKNDCVAGNTFMTLILNPSADRVGRKVNGDIACAVTGINTLSQSSNFNVFPNPTEGTLKITYALENKTEVQFDLYDLSGRLVLQSKDQPSKTHSLFHDINLENIENGIYTLVVRSDNNNKAFKIIKK